MSERFLLTEQVTLSAHPAQHLCRQTAEVGITPMSAHHKPRSSGRWASGSREGGLKSNLGASGW